jgi:hypothetical protein
MQPQQLSGTGHLSYRANVAAEELRFVSATFVSIVTLDSQPANGRRGRLDVSVAAFELSAKRRRQDRDGMVSLKVMYSCHPST